MSAPASRQRGLGAISLLLVLALAAVFVWYSCRSLPDLVAVHFDANGLANGFMRRVPFSRYALAFVVGLPLAVQLIIGISLSIGGDPSRINLPNRDYWLAPERREASTAFLRSHLVRFELLLTAFFVCAHALVVQANHRDPPRLSAVPFGIALALFMGCVAWWTWRLIRRFSRVDVKKH